MNKENCINIGLAIDWMEDPYHESLTSGLNKAAGENGVNLYHFIGGSLENTPGTENLKNYIYNLINEKRLDGLIIAAASIGIHTDLNNLEKFCRRFKDFPVLTISQAFPGIPSVTVLSIKGLQDLMEHLINGHYYRRFAFIKGPEHNQDSVGRFKIFLEALKEADIALDPELVFPGDFTYNSGVNAVKKLLGGNKKLPEVIVAGNDETARAAIEELAAKGYIIPRDIAVVGFDDDQASLYVDPPLTTVRQPIYEVGKKAIENIIALVKKEEITFDVTLSTEMVIRETCGCKSHRLIYHTAAGVRRGTSRPRTQEDLRELSETLLPPILTILGGDDSRGGNMSIKKSIQRIVNAFFDTVKYRKESGFYTAVNIFLDIIGRQNVSGYGLWSIFSRLHDQLIPLLGSQDEKRVGERVWFYTGRLLVLHQDRKMNHLKAVIGRENLFFMQSSDVITSPGDLRYLLEFLKESLRTIGVKSFFLSLYEDPSKKMEESVSRLIFAYSNGGEIKLEKEGTLFPTNMLLPFSRFSSEGGSSYFIEPLYFAKIHLGFIVMEYEDFMDSINNMVRRFFINIVIKGAIYIRQVGIRTRDYEIRVENKALALTEVNRHIKKFREESVGARRIMRDTNTEQAVLEKSTRLRSAMDELEKTLETLEKIRDSLARTEKESSLSNLVTATAHEINIPVGVCITAAAHLKEITKRIGDIYLNENMKRADFEELLETTRESTRLIIANLEKGHDLIEGFKRITTDQYFEEKRDFSLYDYTRKIISNFIPGLKKWEHEIEILCDKELVIKSYPSVFYQIISNLLFNSLTHGYPGGEKGKIVLEFKKDRNGLFFIYTDDGRGISEEKLESVFNPFYTTSGQPGNIGLGLYIVYNLVTRRLNGTILCESREGEGVIFRTFIPVSVF